MGLAHLNLVSVLSFSKAWYHRPRYRFLVSVLSFFEENAQITKPMSNRRLLSTTQIKSVAHISLVLKRIAPARHTKEAAKIHEGQKKLDCCPAVSRLLG